MRFFARRGRFPAPEEVGEGAVRYVAPQVDVPAAKYRAYDHRGRTAEYHRAQIRGVKGWLGTGSIVRRACGHER